MSSEQRTYSVKVSDPHLQQLLEESDNASELFREGAKRLAWERDVLDIETPDLDEDEREAYAWLVEYSAGGRVKFDVAKTKIAQLTQLDKELVKHAVLVPLQRKGYVDVYTGIQEVSVEPVSPSEVAGG